MNVAGDVAGPKQFWEACGKAEGIWFELKEDNCQQLPFVGHFAGHSIKIFTRICIHSVFLQTGTSPIPILQVRRKRDGVTFSRMHSL